MNPVSNRIDGRRATVRAIGEIGRIALPVVAALLAASPALASDELVLVPGHQDLDVGKTVDDHPLILLLLPEPRCLRAGSG